MWNKKLIFALILLFTGCGPIAPPSLTEAEVQEFVRQYVVAQNEGDASKAMELTSRETNVSSVVEGKIDRGWEAIRESTDKNIASSSRFRLVAGTVIVTVLSSDTALAVAPMVRTPISGSAIFDVSGAFTMIIRRSPEGLRLVHEHYSMSPPTPVLFGR